MTLGGVLAVIGGLVLLLIVVLLVGSTEGR